VARIKDLGGTLELTANNTYTGGTFANGGTLRLNTPSANGDTTVAIPGPLTINNATVTLATPNQIKSTSTVTINGGGTLNLSNTAGDNTTVGGITFNNHGGGTPQITSPSAATAGTITKITVSGNITSVNDSAGSTPTIQGTNTNTNLQLDFGDNTTSRTIDVGGTSPIGLIINAAISAGKLLKLGEGMLVLGQPGGTVVNSTFMGGLQIDAGPVRVDNLNALSTNANAVTVGTGTAGSASLVVNTGTAILPTVSLNLNSGALLPMNNNIILAGPVNVAGASTIAVHDRNVVTTARNVTLQGLLSGSGSINIPASNVTGQNGTLTLNNPDNTYSGAITLQPAAILTAQSSTAEGSTLGRASLNMAGGTLNIRDNGSLGSGATLEYGNNLNVTGNSVVSVDRPSANSNNAVQFGNLNLNNSALTVTSGNGYSLAFTGPATLTGSARFNNSATVTVPSFTGSGNLVKSNTGTLITTGLSTAFTGSTTLIGGTLRVAPEEGGAGLGMGPIVINAGATLQSNPLNSGTMVYRPSSITNDGVLRVTTGIADFGTSFINTSPSLTGAQPFSAFTEKFTNPADVGITAFTAGAGADARISLENANNVLTPNPGPGMDGPGVSGGTPLNFNQNDLSTRSNFYFGTTQQGAGYLGRITIGGTVPAGPITFGTNSDDGSALYVDLNGDRVFTANERVVSNFGDHAPQTAIGTVNLAAGTYDIGIGMYNGAGGGVIQATFAPGVNVPFTGHYTITPGGTLGALSQIRLDPVAELISGGFATGTLRMDDSSTLTLPAAAAVTNSTATALVPNGSSTMNLGANHTLTVDSIRGAAGGTITKTGAGTLVVSNTHELGGGSMVQIDGGTVRMNSIATPTSAGGFTVNAGGTLSGTGDLGTATVFVSTLGTVSPGPGPATLNIGGNLDIFADGTFVAELGGTRPGDGTGFYDQLQVGGDAAFDQATLSISTFGGFRAGVSDIFYILITGGTATGQFKGLPEGARFTSTDGFSGRITYLANWTGDQATSTLTGGNDVALYAIPEPGSLSLLCFAGLGALACRRRPRRSA